jgi:glycosyltransferase involved in cell wall biosynthesis
MRVAIIHEWLDTYAGSERVLEQLIALFPQADLYALVDFVPPEARGFLGGRKVTTSFIQRLPLARRRYRNYLGLMPIAVEQFSMAGYDLVISSSHAVAKGVITGPNQVHVSYVHSPMRYAWDLQAQYLEQSRSGRGLAGLYARWLLHRLRMWDIRTANNVDVFVANSRYIALRIRKVYRRDAIVVYPPVDTVRFTLGEGPRQSYVAVGRFVPYKRVDLIVEAFRQMPDLRLTVVGDGAERERIQRLANGASNITMLPPQPHDALVRLLQGARAFVFAAEEDFGIGLVEAQACGTPVIAFGRGGVLDIIDSRRGYAPTGLLFKEQTVPSIIAAVRQFESIGATMTPTLCRANALRFSTARFHADMQAVVDDAMAQAAAGWSVPQTEPIPQAMSVRA